MSKKTPDISPRPAPKGARAVRRPLVLEQLETRALLSAASLVMLPDARVAPTPPPTPTFQGYSPQTIRTAYSYSGVGTGSGQTIAIVDAYNDPTIAADLTAFDNYFGVGAANLSVVNQTGGTTLPSGGGASWSTETALDVEWAHAMAPGAKILLVEANTGALSDLLTAVQTAAGSPGVSVVSISWGSSEFSGETSDDSYFTTPSGHANVTFVASTGDSGAGATWPSSSPNVVAVGGTTLGVTSTGSYNSESAWTDGGGGPSQYEAAPTAQENVTGSFTRSTPDVSYDADPATGYAVYSEGAWGVEGGTSAGAPQWAAIIAIGDQAAGNSLSTAQTLTGLYEAPAADFHDITTGSNGYPATPGYDMATGIGTPIVSKLIPNLIAPAGGNGGGGGGGGGSTGGGGGGHFVPTPSGNESPYAGNGGTVFAFPGTTATQIVVTGGTAGAIGLGQSITIQGAANQAVSLLTAGNLSQQLTTPSTVRSVVTPSGAASSTTLPGTTGAEALAATALGSFDGMHFHVARWSDADQADLLAGDSADDVGDAIDVWTDASVQDGGDAS